MAELASEITLGQQTPSPPKETLQETPDIPSDFRRMKFELEKVMGHTREERLKWKWKKPGQ